MEISEKEKSGIRHVYVCKMDLGALQAELCPRHHAEIPNTSLQTPGSMGNTEVDWSSPVYMTSVLINKVKLDSLTHRGNK